MEKLKELESKLAEIREKIRPFEDTKNLIEEEIKEIKEVLEKEEFEKNKDLVIKMNKLYVEYLFVDLDEEESRKEVLEDDGALHICIGKIRGCFICNQDISKSEFNKRARPIVKEFGFKWSDLK